MFHKRSHLASNNKSENGLSESSTPVKEGTAPYFFPCNGKVVCLTMEPQPTWATPSTPPKQSQEYLKEVIVRARAKARALTGSRSKQQ